MKRRLARLHARRNGLPYPAWTEAQKVGSEYSEGAESMFTHQGTTYMVDELLLAVKGMKSVHFPISKLVWMIGPEGTYDAERVQKTDLSYPVIVHEYSPGNYATLDGFHRVVRAAKEGRQTIPAIVVDDALIRKLTKQVVSKEGFFTKSEAYTAAARVTKECDEMGIDSTWSLPDRVARLQDIHQGSSLMFEERQRKAAYLGNAFKDHVNDVVKNLPSTISEQQVAKG